MSVSPGYREASVTKAAVAGEVRVDALVNMSQMAFPDEHAEHHPEPAAAALA
jgi:hypothetical protein